MSLSWQSVGPEDGRLVFVLHGILGSAKNWRVFARQMVQRWPEWRVVSVDLRNHGESWRPQGEQTLAEVAADLHRVAEEVGVPEAVVGHSYGGKVALVYAGMEPSVETVWVLDARPDAVGPLPADNEVRAVFETLAEHPGPFPSRKDASTRLGSTGLPEGILAWMSTNLRRGGEGVEWRFELDAARRMLGHYLEADLYADMGLMGADIHLVRATASGRWPAAAMERLERAVARGRMSVHEIGTGHWVHVEDPEGLLSILGETFR